MKLSRHKPDMNRWNMQPRIQKYDVEFLSVQDYCETTPMRYFNLLLVLSIALLQGCAPVFSDFQSARMVERGAVEVTPAGGYVSSPQWTLGAQIAYGLSDRTELRARLTHVFTGLDTEGSDWLEESVNDINVISAGLKFSLVEDRLALHLPIGAYFNAEDGLGGLHGHPALIASIPVCDDIDLNPSLNAILPGGLVAINLGAALSNHDRFTVRPEVGVLVNYGFVSAGVGFSYRFAR